MSSALSTRRRFLVVLLGGFFGTIARYLLSLFIQGYLGKNWPYDILTINVTGAFLLAFVTTFADAALLIGPTRRLLINVGFLGAYTTFSTFALGDVLLLANGSVLPAFLYLALSLAGGMLAVLLGDVLGQWLIRRLQPHASQVAIPIGETPLAPVARIHGEEDHLDVQDDLLLSDEQEERETERR